MNLRVPFVRRSRLEAVERDLKDFRELVRDGALWPCRWTPGLCDVTRKSAASRDRHEQHEHGGIE